MATKAKSIENALMKRLYSPKGTLKFPKLHEPDYHFNKECGDYSTQLVLDPNEETTKALQRDLQSLATEYVDQKSKESPKVKKADIHFPWEDDLVKSEEEEDTLVESGQVAFKFRQKAVLVWQGKEVSKKPKLVDSRGYPCPEGTVPGPGTIAKVCFDARPSYAQGTVYISLKPVAVQVLELHEWTGGDDFEFEEEDGWTAGPADEGDGDF